LNASRGQYIQNNPGDIKTDAAPIAMSYIEENHTLVASLSNMTMCTYSLDNPNPNKKYKTLSTWASPGVQMAVTYMPKNRLLYSGATTGDIFSWKIKERKIYDTLTGHTDMVMSLVTLPKLNYLASASLDKTVSIWDAYTNQQLLKLYGHKKGVLDIDYSSNYRLLVSAGFEHDAYVWSPFVHTLVYRLKGHHHSLVGCQAIKDTPEIITADTSGVLKLWDIRNFQCVQSFDANLSGQEVKDGSSLPCKALNQEDDSRIYAASKVLFAFDQMRVVHDATTDYSNVLWMLSDEEHMTIITVSERNVMIWDALLGSKTTT
jgi:WD40 repeat protein